MKTTVKVSIEVRFDKDDVVRHQLRGTTCLEDYSDLLGELILAAVIAVEPEQTMQLAALACAVERFGWLDKKLSPDQPEEAAFVDAAVAVATAQKQRALRARQAAGSGEVEA